MSEKRKRVKLLDPVIGNDRNKIGAGLKSKMLNSKLDIAMKFLDVLMQPNNFMNSDAIKFGFDSKDIIALCNVA